MYSPNNSQLRKAFRGVSQFPDTVARIMMGNRNLKIAYESLLTTSTATIAFACFILTTTFAADIVMLRTIIWPLLIITFLHVIDAKHGVFGLVAGTSAAGLHLLTDAVHIAPDLVLTTVVISIILSVVAVLFLMKHAIVIASLVWEKEMTGEMEPDMPSDDESPDTRTP